MNSEMQNEFGPDILDGDEQAVSRMVGSLPRVEAPHNFERRVMSRIAGGSPVRRGPFAVPSWAYAVPLALALIIAVIVVLRSNRQPDGQEPVAVVPQLPVQQDTRPYETAPAANDASDPGESVRQQPQTVATAGSRRNIDRASSPANSGKGGSYDEALPQQKVIRPAGLQDTPSTSSANRGEVIMPTSIPVGEVLSTIGVEAEFNDGWKVGRVFPNSIAERSGVKPGDVVIGLDDQQLLSDTDFKGSGTIGTIRVRRNGKIISMKLK